MKKRILIALVVVLALAATALVVWAADGLVSYWPFDEGIGTTAGDAVNGNHGTIYGATWVDGKFGKALSFDGDGDYVSIPDSTSLDLSGEMTVEAWIKVAVHKNYNAIVVKGPDMAENYELLVGYPTVDDVVSAILFTDGRKWLSTGGVIAQDTWHHVSVTCKPNEWRIYVDGVKRAERTDVASAPATNNYPVWIGNEQGTTGRVMYGLIDEVRIWNRALSAAELAFVAPVVNAGDDATINKGSNFTSSGSFTDAGPGPWTATVDYGDGSGVQSLTLTDKNFSLTHTYDDNGSYTVTVRVTDEDGLVGFDTATYTVIYNWDGFFRPVDNLPMLNVAKAGSAIPVKFSLSGDQGLDIFAEGYPKSLGIVCNGSALVDAIEETVTAGSSSLSYDPVANQYVYVWKTDKGWAGTCRQLVVMLNDGTYHRANFNFTK